MLALFTLMLNIYLMVMKTRRPGLYLFNIDTSNQQLTDLKCCRWNSNHHIFVIMLKRVIKMCEGDEQLWNACIYLIFWRVFQNIKLVNHFLQRRWSPCKRCYLCVSINRWNTVLFKKERNCCEGYSCYIHKHW